MGIRENLLEMSAQLSQIKVHKSIAVNVISDSLAKIPFKKVTNLPPTTENQQKSYHKQMGKKMGNLKWQ